MSHDEPFKRVTGFRYFSYLIQCCVRNPPSDCIVPATEIICCVFLIGQEGAPAKQIFVFANFDLIHYCRLQIQKKSSGDHSTIWQFLKICFIIVVFLGLTFGRYPMLITEYFPSGISYLHSCLPYLDMYYLFHDDNKKFIQPILFFTLQLFYILDQFMRQEARCERQSMVREAEGKVYSVKTSQFLKGNYSQFNPGYSRINIQVSGHGVFKQDELFKNFLQHFQQVLNIFTSQSNKIKHVKLKISDFIVNSRIQEICKLLLLLKKKELSSLEIHTFGLKEVTMNDFLILLKLSQISTDTDFSFTLQCANWNFKQNQPKVQDIERTFRQFLQDQGDVGLMTKMLRIEMSGWYLTEDQGYQFLGFQKAQQYYNQQEKKWKVDENILHDRVKHLHSDLIYFLKQIVRSRVLTLFQFDLRNWANILRMNDFKKEVDSKKLSDRQLGLSIISKSYLRNPSQNTNLDIKIMV